MAFWGIVFTCALGLPAITSNFLTFRSYDSFESFPEEIISTNGELVQWSAAWPTDVRLVFLNASTLNLQFNCTIDNISVADETTGDEKIQVFFEYPDPFIKESVTLNRSRQEHTINLNGVTIVLNVNLESNAIVSVVNLKQSTSLPLFYFYCKASNRYTKIISNRAHVLDLRQNFPTRLWTPSMKDVNSSLRNQTFNCLKTSLKINEKIHSSTQLLWKQPSVGIPFRWYICFNETLSACLKKKLPIEDFAISKMTFFQILEDGVLFWPKISHVTHLQGKRLLCTLFETPVAFYSAIPNLTDSHFVSQQANLSIIQPRESLDIVLFNSTNWTLTIPCCFIISSEEVKVEWRVTRNSATMNLTTGWNELHKIFVSTANVTFIAPFSDFTSGLYKCLVTEIGGRQQLIGHYNVSVKGLPHPSPYIPDQIIVVGKRTMEVTCDFDDQHVTSGLALLGNVVSGKESIERNVRIINKQYSKIMAPLKFGVRYTQPKKSTWIKYTAYHLISDHQVTCIGYRPPFSIRQRILVRILQPIIDFKESSNTTDSMHVCLKWCQFVCMIRNKEQSVALGIKPFWIWRINGNEIDPQVFHYQEVVSDDNSTLKIKFVHEASYRTREANLTCQLRWLKRNNDSLNTRIDFATMGKWFPIGSGQPQKPPPGIPMFIWIFLGLVVDLSVSISLISVACVFARRRRHGRYRYHGSHRVWSYLSTRRSRLDQ